MIIGAELEDVKPWKQHAIMCNDMNELQLTLNS